MAPGRPGLTVYEYPSRRMRLLMPTADRHGVSTVFVDVLVVTAHPNFYLPTEKTSSIIKENQTEHLTETFPTTFCNCLYIYLHDAL